MVMNSLMIDRSCLKFLLLFMLQTDNKGIFLIIKGQTELIFSRVNSEKSDRVLAYQLSRLILYTYDFFSTSRI